MRNLASERAHLPHLGRHEMHAPLRKFRGRQHEMTPSVRPSVRDNDGCGCAADGGGGGEEGGTEFLSLFQRSRISRDIWPQSKAIELTGPTGLFQQLRSKVPDR